MKYFVYFNFIVLMVNVSIYHKVNVSEERSVTCGNYNNCE